jgi:hypothetical protein
MLCTCPTSQQHSSSSSSSTTVSSKLATTTSGGSGGGGNSSRRRAGGSGGGADHPASSQRWGQLLAGVLAGALLLPTAPAAASTVAANKGKGQRKKAEPALPSWELDAFVERMWDCSGPILNNMGFSGLMGMCAAAALKVRLLNFVVLGCWLVDSARP